MQFVAQSHSEKLSPVCEKSFNTLDSTRPLTKLGQRTNAKSCRQLSKVAPKTYI